MLTEAKIITMQNSGSFRKCVGMCTVSKGCKIRELHLYFVGPYAKTGAHSEFFIGGGGLTLRLFIIYV
jgi:hypothetical protein